MDKSTLQDNVFNVFANRAIAAVIGSEELAIDAGTCVQYLNQYLLDIYVLALGGKLSDLGLSERRQMHRPYLLAGGQRVYGHDALRDASLTPVGSVAVLRVVGFMQAESSGGSSPVRGMRSFAEDLYAAYDNEHIKGVLVEVNSGGGELMAMEIASAAIEARNKPVLSHVYLAGSAAYGVAASTDEVIALSGMTRVGSIGAVVSLNRRALQEYAEEWIDIYGSSSPDKNAEFRAALNGDFSLIQNLVDDATDRFQRKIAKLRGLSLEDDLVKEALSGGMFTAHQAKRRGLVDGVGNLNYALKRLDAWVDIYKQKK